jgi:hypothetical protein
MVGQFNIVKFPHGDSGTVVGEVPAATLDSNNPGMMKQFEASIFPTSKVPEVHVYPKNPVTVRVMQHVMMIINIALDASLALSLIMM